MAEVLSLEIVPDANGSERMLMVDHYERIRRKVVIEGKESGRPGTQRRGAHVDSGHLDFGSPASRTD